MYVYSPMATPWVDGNMILLRPERAKVNDYNLFDF
jgi:hypothetical protein